MSERVKNLREEAEKICRDWYKTSHQYDEPKKGLKMLIEQALLSVREEAIREAAKVCDALCEKYKGGCDYESISYNGSKRDAFIQYKGKILALLDRKAGV